MKILIIVRSFAPDGIISAIRPTKIAKYLALAGHEVVVIRSGIIVGKADRINNEGIEKVKVLSYEGEESPAERFDKGDFGNIYENARNSKGSLSRKNDYVELVKRVVHTFLDPLSYYYVEGFIIRKKVVQIYKSNNDLRGFDVVISSFSPLGCIQAGKSICSYEKALWVVDFRDLMNNQGYSPLVRFINSFLQKGYLKKADLCLCVSEGNRHILADSLHGKYSRKVITLYNGFDNTQNVSSIENRHRDNVLRICYTGSIHKGLQDFMPALKVLKEINTYMPVCVDYAGSQPDFLIQQARYLGIQEIVKNHGYLSRSEVSQLQEEADLFLVLAWNTKKDRGILTGKFYEALQHKKPIVAIVSGECPESELKTLIDKYHLGVCYEEATDEKSYAELQDYITRQALHVLNGEKTEYNPSAEVFEKFEYQRIVHELEYLITEVKNETFGLDYKQEIDNIYEKKCNFGRRSR